MLLTREQISRENGFGELTESILERDEPKLIDTFHQLIARDGRSVGQALSLVLEAEAPYIQVPSHINIRDGQITLVNNDHTMFGLRTSVDLVPYLPKGYELLPLMQSIWYIPAGLDIWNQLLAKYPGRYAIMKGINVPPPDYPPAVWQADQPAIVEPGPLEERLQAHLVASTVGQVDRAFGLTLGLAADEGARSALRDQLLFLGIIDLQDSTIGRKARNTGHKAVRARATTDLADVVGWERSHGVFYTGVPDMAVGPLYYSMYDAACVTANAELPEAGKNFRELNQTPLTATEVDELIRVLLDADPKTAWDQVTTSLRAGKSIQSLGDALQVAAAELVLHTAEMKEFADGHHAYDYCNIVNYWFRTTNNPNQARAVYLMASYVNDVAHLLHRLPAADLDRELNALDGTKQPPAHLLAELDEAIRGADASRSTALASAYVKSGAGVRDLMAQLALTACKFQNDPHNQQFCHSTFEEYANNSTRHRDRLLIANARIMAGRPKMPRFPDEPSCFDIYEEKYLH